MTIKIEVFTADGEGSELVAFPSRWVICPACEGHGTDRGRSVERDGGGFTASEWAEEDEDFRADYMAGRYDRPCEECKGNGKIFTIDREQAAITRPAELARYDAFLADEAGVPGDVRSRAKDGSVTMGMLAYIYDSPLGNCSNKGISATTKQVCVVNVEGPFEPNADTPAVKLVKRERIGNVICEPVGLEGKWTMFGGAYVTTSDSRFGAAVKKLSGYEHSFPVALHDRVEA